MSRGGALRLAGLMVAVVLVVSYWATHRAPTSTERTSAAPTATAPTCGSRTSRTPEPSGAPALLTFAVQADPHLDEQSDAQLYRRSLAQVVAAKPAFLVDLGDDFMIDKQADRSEANLRSRYALMKSFYQDLGGIPLHLVMGNHDGELGWDPLNTHALRAEYFPDQTAAHNYGSFTAGDSLFVILDPYSATTTKPGSDGWAWTLGRTQYDWLRATLAASTARHTFVFIHQLVGGDEQGRGGIEYAARYEWGGLNADGTQGFAAHRPGWGEPIHALLCRYGVDAVFKGHDHFYAHQVLDGLTYQTLPQPSHPGEDVKTATDYGYTHGDIVGGSGFLRVSVRADGTTVEFVTPDGAVARRYVI